MADSGDKKIGFFVRMSPDAFGYYSEKIDIPWTWAEDTALPGHLTADEVGCIAGRSCSGRFVPAGDMFTKYKPLFWAEAASVAAAGIPASFLQIITDRWKDGDPQNNIPLYACDERPNAGFERALCKNLMEKMYDPGRRNPGKYHGGDLEGLRTTIPYIKELGFEGVWISPLWENPVGFAPGSGPWAEANGITGYHGYWGKNFGWLDPHLGNGSRESNEEFYADVISEFHSGGIALQVDLIMNHAGPITRCKKPFERPVLVNNDYQLCTLDAGRIYFGNELAFSYWDEHLDMGLKVFEFDRNPLGDVSRQLSFHHASNISFWGFKDAEECSYWQRMETGTLAFLGDLNIYGNRAAHDLIIATGDKWTEFASGARIDTLIYVVNRNGDCNEYDGTQDIVVESTARLRASKRGFVPVVGEWFDANHPQDLFGAGIHFYLSTVTDPKEQLDLFDFGSRYALHDIFGGSGRPLGPFHSYLKTLTGYPPSVIARLSPFVDNHDMPLLLNEKDWPTYEDLHQAHILSFMFPGTPYVYGQNLKYLHDYDFRIGLFDEGGDPFNRIMVDPELPAGGHFKYPMERLMKLLNKFRRENMRALAFGDVKTGLIGAKDKFDFGNDNILAIKREFDREAVLYLHARKISKGGEFFDPDAAIRGLQVDMPPGVYEDPFTGILYLVGADHRLIPAAGEYRDPVWERNVLITESAEYTLLPQEWTDSANGNRFKIDGGMVYPLTGGRLKPHRSVTEDIDDDGIIFTVDDCRPVPVDGKYRLINGQGIEEPVEIKNGQVKLVPDYRTVVLAKKSDAYDSLHSGYIPVEHKHRRGK